MEFNLAQDGLTPEEEAQARKPTTPELDSAGWLRMGQLASFTGQSLGQAPTNTKQATAVDNPGKPPGLWAVIAADTVRQFQKSWNWVFHPIQSVRQWLADVLEILSAKPTVNAARGTAPQSGPTPEKEPVAQSNVMQEAKADSMSKATAPSIDDTWAQLKDRLFEAAARKADPAQVVPGIIAGIPDEHRAIIAERLTGLAEMAQETAKALAQREMAAKEPGKGKAPQPKGQDIPLPECPPETAIDIPEPDREPRLKRQVPAQPVAKACQAQTARVEAEAQKKAKAAQR